MEVQDITMVDVERQELKPISPIFPKTIGILTQEEIEEGLNENDKILEILEEVGVDAASPEYQGKFFSSNITIFINSFLGNIIKRDVLPIIDFRPVLTQALVNAVLECWFKINSSIQIGTFNNKQFAVASLNINEQTKFIYSFLGFNLRDGDIQRLSSVKRIVSDPNIDSIFAPDYKTEKKQKEVFLQLLKITGLILRTCRIIIEDPFLSIATENDIKLLETRSIIFEQNMPGTFISPFRGFKVKF